GQFLGSELHIRPLLVAPGAGGDDEGQARRMAELDAPLEAIDAPLARHPRREGEERFQASAFELAAHRRAPGCTGLIARDRSLARRQTQAHTTVAGAGDGLQRLLEWELGEDVGETAQLNLHGNKPSGYRRARRRWGINFRLRETT